MEEEVISNRFEGYEFNNKYEWVCIHDEEKHFPKWDPNKPAIKLCGSTLRVRANDAWTKLPRHVKEAMVAHEIAHRELEHHLKPALLFRLVTLALGEEPADEIAADRYACKLVPKDQMLRCLHYLKNRTYDAFTKAEYVHRLKALGWKDE